MEIDLTIHTYGHFLSMFYILNGIALIMNSSFTDSLIKLMITATMAYHGFRMAYAGADGGSRQELARIMSMSVIVGALIIPKADIDIEDRVTGQKETVSNLPVAFAIPVGVLEAFGGAITSGFEQAFTPVGSSSFKDYGMIFGARLVNESRNWRIANPEFAGNMDAFLKRCVVLESMIGTRFSPQDIIDSDNILELVSKMAGTFRKVDFRLGKKTQRYNCKEAADQLQGYVSGELNALSKRYLNSDFGQAGGKHLSRGGSSSSSILNNQLKNNIELAYKGSLGVDIPAEQIIHQTMMINAIHDYNNKSDLYGYSRAANNQESSWMLGGALASEYLPILLSVIKGLIYASFIFLVPLMIIAGGMQRYLNYLIVVVSLQLWPALNAVLNLFVELYTGVLGSSVTGRILTYATFNQSHLAIDKIVTVASGLQWTLPLLSMAIARGGAHAFINLASNIGSTSMSAASMAASEVTSGARNFDNVAIGNMQRAQQMAHKTDYNSSYAAGASTYQHMDGMMERVTASGETILASGAGQTASTGTVHFVADEGRVNQLHEGFNQSQSLVESDQVAYNSSRNSTLSNMASKVSQLAQREAAGHTHNYEAMGEQGKSLQQAVNYAKELHDQNNYGWAQASSASVKAYTDAGGSVPIPGVKLEGGVRAEGGIEASNTSNQSLSHDERVLTANDASKNFNNMARAASNENWMKENSVDSSYAKDIRASYEQMQSIGRNLSMHKEQAASYSNAINSLDNFGGSSSQDMYHLVEQRLMNDHNISQQDAHKMIENHDVRATRAWNNIVDEKIADFGIPINNMKEAITGDAANNQMQNFENTHTHKINEQPTEYVNRMALENGLDETKIQNKIADQGNNLQEKGNQMRSENNVQHSSVEWHNKTLKNGLEQRADKYEKNRLSTTIGVGGPDQAQRLKENYQGNQERASNGLKGKK